MRHLTPIFALIAVAPVLAVQVPGLGDYLNHLARMHVLVSLAHSPELQRYYEIHWAPIPYLAMDAIVPLLARILPIYLAGKIFVLACMILPASGAACLHYAIHRRLSLVPLAAWLVSANTLLSLGFLNYLFTLGLALLLLAAWIATERWPRWRRAGAFAPAVLVLYFGHAFACGAYCLGVAGVETGKAIRARLRPLPAVAADLLAAGAQAVPALAFAATLDVGAGYVGRLQTHFGDLGSKLVALCSPVLFLHDAANGLILLALLGLLAVLLRHLRLASTLWPACVPVAIAAVLMPHVLASTWGMDLRLPLFLVLLLIGSASFPTATAWRAPAIALLAALLLWKSADAWRALDHLDAQIAQTRTVLATMPRGARLLVVNVAGKGTGRESVPNNTIWHMPLTAVIDRDAFVPTLFNGLTTIRMRADYRASSTPNGLPVTPDQLRAGVNPAAPPAIDPGDGEGARIYWMDWPHHFDFVLIQRFGVDPGPLPANLVLTKRAKDVDLYRVLHD